MNHATFIEVIERVPLLAAEGLMVPGDPENERKRHEFLNSPERLQETIDAAQFMATIGKSERFSEWQRKNCCPESLQGLIEWHVGRPISRGSIIAAALHLGFTMGVQGNSKVYFNLLAPQIETELAHLRTHQQISEAALI